MSDRIEKRIELKATLSRVWRALTDYREFGEWFLVKMDGPFVPGGVAHGQVLYPGYEHLVMEFVVQEMALERTFSYTWHPFAVKDLDYSQEPSTFVVFELEPTETGTLLTVTETGFDKLPAERRADAFRANTSGWSQQMGNIESYLAKNG